MKYIYRIIVGIVFAMFLANGTYAYNITGYVNNTNGIGISGIIICTYNNGCQKLSTVTDGSGYYKMTGLNSGTYYVKIDIDDRDKNYFYKPSKNMLNNIAPNLVSKVTLTANVNNINFTKIYINDAISGFKLPMSNFNPNRYGYTFGQWAPADGNVYHPGQDYNSYSNNAKCYDGKNGTRINATADGIVVDIRPKTDNNGCLRWGGIVIKHFYKGKAYYSQYGHLYIDFINNPLKVGQKITKGQLLGYEDQIGCQPPCVHLHFEIRNAKHPQPYYRGYWDYPTLKNLNNTNKYYEHPDAFIPSSGTYADLPTILVDERELLYSGEYPLPSRWFSVNNTVKFIDVPPSGDIDPSIGYGSHFQYAYTTTSSTPTAWGNWSFYISKNGDYEISAFIPPTVYKSYKATYKLDGISITTINQSASKNWTKLGTFPFHLITGYHNISLANNNGESGKKLIYDAIKMVYNDDWPMFKHNIERTGLTSDNIKPPLKLLWKFKTNGWVTTSSPAIVNNTVYVGSTEPDRNIYALNASNGHLKWNYTTQSYGSYGGVWSSPTVVNNIVYVGARDKNIYALYANNGTLKWKFQTDGMVGSSPLLVNGLLYLTSSGSTYGIYALEAESGKLKWRYPASTISSPTYKDGLLYVGAWDKNIYALYANNGTLRWKYQTNDSVESTPTIADETVYVGSRDMYVYALNSFNGKLKWTFRALGYVWTSGAINNGILYIGSTTEFYAIDTKTGKLVWKNDLGPRMSSPAIANNIIYITGGDPATGYGIFAVDAKIGNILWRYILPGTDESSPAIANGTVFFGSRDGYVYAFAQ